jgi:hypothetical protein
MASGRVGAGRRVGFGTERLVARGVAQDDCESDLARPGAVPLAEGKLVVRDRHVDLGLRLPRLPTKPATSAT